VHLAGCGVDGVAALKLRQGANLPPQWIEFVF
jgi:hypothetical protein